MNNDAINLTNFYWLFSQYYSSFKSKVYEVINTETEVDSSEQKRQDKNLIKTYLLNLDKISVYVLRRATRHSRALRANKRAFCADVTKYNHALLKPRLHFQCGRSLKGRYVYVEAQGVNEKEKKFGAILCEVMVYE